MYRHLVLLSVLFLALFPASVVCTTRLEEKVDLICSNDDPADCYPRIFVPTEEFQVIRPDQSIPPGLHVRLDMQTGLKEAKLYDPSQDDDESNAVQVVASEGVSTAIEVSTEQETPEIAYDGWGQQQTVLKGATEHVTGDNPHRKPRVAHVPSSIFEDTLRQIVTKGNNPKEAVPLLEILHETVDDPYFGMEVVRDRAVVKALVALLLADPGRHAAGGAASGAAASVLGAAISNNAPANAALMAHHFAGNSARPEQHRGTVLDALRTALRLREVPFGDSEGLTLMTPDDRHHLFLLSKIWQDPKNRFLEDLRGLVEHVYYECDHAQSAVIARKLADMVSDHYAVGFRESDAGVIAPPTTARSPRECSILLDWLVRLTHVHKNWDVCSPSEQARYTPGEKELTRDAHVRVLEARRAVAGVLQATPDNGGCSGIRPDTDMFSEQYEINIHAALADAEVAIEGLERTKDEL